MNKNVIILKDIKNHLSNQFGSEVTKVILFGSRSKNMEHPDSDYDILIILKTKHNWETKFKIIDLCYDIDLKHDIIIDPHILAEEEINTLRGKQPIFSNALQNGITL